MVRIRFRHLLPILAALTLWLPAQAQLHCGRAPSCAGHARAADSLASKTDSLADLSLVRELDSLMTDSSRPTRPPSRSCAPTT
ncbi:MAG: hypothetical protein ACLU5I_03150 [Alistipes finegoldii]